MVSTFKCCVPYCGVTRKDQVTMHSFPDFEKDPDRFKSWLNAIGEKILAMDKETVWEKGRVCHKHFERQYHTWTKTLSPNAIPTLYLPDVFKKVPNKPDPDVIMGGSKRAESTDNKKCEEEKTLKKSPNKNASDSITVKDTLWEHESSQEWLDEESDTPTDSDDEIERAIPENTKKTERAWGKNCVGCLRGGRELMAMDSVEVVVRPGLPHLACHVATLYKEIIGMCPPVASGGESWSMCGVCVNQLTTAYLFKRQCVESLELLAVNATQGAASDRSGRAFRCDAYDTSDTKVEGDSQRSVGSPEVKEEHIITMNTNKSTCDMEVDNKVSFETAPHIKKCSSSNKLPVKAYPAVKLREVKLSMKTDQNEQGTMKTDHNERGTMKTDHNERGTMKTDHNERGTNKAKRCRYCGQAVGLSDTMQSILDKTAISQFGRRRKCFVCNKVLRSFLALAEHMETHKQNTCDQCVVIGSQAVAADNDSTVYIKEEGDG